MPRSDRNVIVAIVGCLIGALFVAWNLYPEKPKLAGDSAYQEQRAGYRAGGADCDPANIARLVGRESLKRRDSACREAEEQSRQQANSIVEARRAADAADASAIAAYEQTRIAASGAFLGIVTMFAAIGAAWYARDAARHTQSAATAAHKQIMLTSSAQRAWINPEPKITKIEFDGLFYILAEVIIRNIGVTVAENVMFHASIGQSDTDGYQNSKFYFEANRGNGFLPASVILPGGYRRFIIKSAYATNGWCAKGIEERLNLAVHFFCSYTLVGDDPNGGNAVAHVSEGDWRLRMVGEDLFESHGMPYNFNLKADAVELVGGLVKAT